MGPFAFSPSVLVTSSIVPNESDLALRLAWLIDGSRSRNGGETTFSGGAWVTPFSRNPSMSCAKTVAGSAFWDWSFTGGICAGPLR